MPFVVTPTQQGNTFLDLLTEFYLRGYNYLSEDTTGQARAKRWINQAMHELASSANWSWLETTATGTPPLALDNVGTILSVVDTTLNSELYGRQRGSLVDAGNTDLTLTGTPAFWYLEDTTLNVYPVSTNSLSVRYVVVPDDLAADADVCVVPKRYTNILIDLAVVRALKDSDNYAAAQALQADVSRQLQDMFAAELPRGDMQFVAVRGNSEDW